mmetsp:Transcript_35964/g.101850  ORF Transcript_35964/g.101850 Transcript_35964/m.101850 type:complete len:201 (+) Transcript_35964:1947-2549(+)
MRRTDRGSCRRPHGLQVIGNLAVLRTVVAVVAYQPEGLLLLLLRRETPSTRGTQIHRKAIVIDAVLAVQYGFHSWSVGVRSRRGVMAATTDGIPEAVGGAAVGAHLRAAAESEASSDCTDDATHARPECSFENRFLFAADSVREAVGDLRMRFVRHTVRNCSKTDGRTLAASDGACEMRAAGKHRTQPRLGYTVATKHQG